MRVAVETSMIRLGHSAGVEMFTSGLLKGMSIHTRGLLEVNVLHGTVDQWRSTVPSDGIVWRESRMPLRTDTRLGQWGRRWIPPAVRDSRSLRSMVTLARQGASDRHRQADVVLLPTGTGPLPPRPSVVVMHDFRAFHEAFRAPGYAEQQRKNMEQAAAVIVSWPHPYQEALLRFPDVSDRIVLIPVPPLQLPARLLPVAPEAGLLLYPSSTAPHKNHAVLLEAMTHLPGHRLVCPGPLVEPEASRLLARAAEPDLAGRVSFPGFVSADDLNHLYARADAVVVPSLWEAASGAMLEAFAWGLPVACADSDPLLSQLQFTGGEATVFAHQDPEALADAVRRLLTDRERFAAASARAGERLAGRTWEATGRDYLDVLTWVAEGRPGPVPRSDFGRMLNAQS